MAENNTNAPLIETSAVGFTYQGSETPALQDVTLSIGAGECVLLCGKSGCGKTTVTCAILQALCHRGLSVASFKCGPDYIDPMFHSRIIGTRSRNLDAFLCGREQVPALLQHSAGRDISVIEGVMGYYDGLAGTSSENSTADIARLTQSPTVLVVSAKGMSLTLAALLRGFLQFEQNTIRGVILNGISPRMTDYYAGIVEQNTGLSVFGAMPTDAMRSISFCTVSYFFRTFSPRSGEFSPTRTPIGTRRSSALSCRSSRRYSEREVIMRYGSFVPRVTRSSISVPMYPSARSSTSGSSPLSLRAALMPATRPCAAASS